MNTKSIKKEKVIFAFNYQMIGKRTMKRVADFSENFESEIHLIFETQGEELPGTQTEIFHKLFEEGIPGFSFEMIFYPQNQYLKAVLEYASRN